MRLAIWIMSLWASSRQDREDVNLAQDDGNVAVGFDIGPGVGTEQDEIDTHFSGRFEPSVVEVLAVAGGDHVAHFGPLLGFPSPG